LYAIGERTLTCGDGSTLLIHFLQTTLKDLTNGTNQIGGTWKVTLGTGRFTLLKGQGTWDDTYCCGQIRRTRRSSLAGTPEVYDFAELVGVLREAVGSRARIVGAPPTVARALAALVGLATRDVLLTADELAGLRADLLVSAVPPTAPTSFREWVAAHANALGRRYSSELTRHFRRRPSRSSSVGGTGREAVPADS
jgi:hypothetical protein